MIKIMPFEVAHSMELQDSGRFPPMGENRRAYAITTFQRSRGTAFTVFEGNQILGCAGISVLWPGVGEAWTMISNEWRAKPLSLHRLIKRGLAQFSTQFHRVELYVIAEFTEGYKWAERLGFVKEGLRKSYTSDKKDVMVFVKLNH